MPRKYSGPLQKGKKSAYVRRKNIGGYMKKTTKKGAYRKNAKKAMVTRRNPMVESKSRSSEQMALKVPTLTPTVHTFDTVNQPRTLSNLSAYTQIPLPTITYMTRGMDDSDMIGNSIFAKYLNLKVEFTFPKHIYAINVPAEIYLVHGWIKSNPNRNSRTIPNVEDFTWHGGSDDDSSQEVFTNTRVAEYFDERADKLRFLPKDHSELQIISQRKITPKTNKTFSLPLQGTDLNTLGSVPMVNKTCNWPLMRKFHYDKGTNPDDTSENADFYYINGSSQWIPFCCVFSPQYADYGQSEANNLPSIRSNQQLYYTDS